MSDSLIDKYRLQNQFGRLIGMDFTIIKAGEVDYKLTLVEKHLATPKAAHGGLISSLVDAALGVAGLSAVHEENKVVSTVEYKLNFLNPALLNDELLAKAKVEQKGKRLLIISCDVYAVNRNNLLIAKALGTFNSYDATKAGY